MVSLNRAVAVARVQGPAAALELVDSLATDGRMTNHHRLLATRAHLLKQLGDPAGAADSYRAAVRREPARAAAHGSTCREAWGQMTCGA